MAKASGPPELTAARTWSCSADPSLERPRSWTEETSTTLAKACWSRLIAVVSAGPRTPSGRTARIGTAVRFAWWKGVARRAARMLGTLAGRKSLLLSWVTLARDGSNWVATAPTTQTATMTQRKRTANLPTAAKNLLAFTSNLLSESQLAYVVDAIYTVSSRRSAVHETVHFDLDSMVSVGDAVEHLAVHRRVLQ